jgi:predicted nucleic acid-binding protein
VSFVVDASVTMAWCFEDEATPASEAVLDQLSGERAIVPGLWTLEVTNVLLAAERRGRLTEAQATRFVSVLSALPIDISPDIADLVALLAAGRRHELSAYDAAYLTLAARTGLPLATLDDKLAAAARSAGITLLIG